MRLAILSDIHGNLGALEAVVDDLERRGVDAVVNLGDSFSGALRPQETAEFLMAQSWLQLAGNHERHVLETPPEEMGRTDRHAHTCLSPAVFEWMARLRPTARFSDEIFLCHASPASDVEYFIDEIDGNQFRIASHDQIDERIGSIAAEVFACGHTHTPRMIRSRRGQLLVNPGSVGLQAYRAHHPAYVVESGNPDARYAIVEGKRGQWAAELIAVPYDHRAAADLARTNSFPDWEKALLTGYAP